MPQPVASLWRSAGRRPQSSAHFVAGPCYEHDAELRAVKTFRPTERPDVLIQVDGDWYPGELRQWSRDPAGGWWANVSWRQAPGETFLDTFPAQRVCEDKESASGPDCNVKG